jgi:hypothetical protein
VRLTVIAVAFTLGYAAAALAFRARARLLEDKAFTKGWAGALRYQDERNPEVS